MQTERYCYKYPHPAVTTDCVVFTLDAGVIKVLLIKRGNEPYKGKWAFPGGFLNPDETAEEGVMRELREETNIQPDWMEQLKVFTDPKRDPRERIITIAFIGIAKYQAVEGNNDAGEARWFAFNELPDLAFDHSEIFKIALRKLDVNKLLTITNNINEI